MTWSFGSPDGRATSELVAVAGELRCRWRRVGDRDVFKSPRSRSDVLPSLDRLATDLDTKRDETDATERNRAAQLRRLNGADLHQWNQV